MAGESTRGGGGIELFKVGGGVGDLFMIYLLFPQT